MTLRIAEFGFYWCDADIDTVVRAGEGRQGLVVFREAGLLCNRLKRGICLRRQHLKAENVGCINPPDPKLGLGNKPGTG
jgi:hypothetical protein